MVLEGENMTKILSDSVMTQIAFLVEDMEESRKSFSAFFGIEATEAVSAGDFPVVETEYNGTPAKEAGALLSFLKFCPRFEIELICPNQAPSVWRDWLNVHGEGFHHLAFQVPDMEKAITECEAFGMELKQRGYYSDRSGRYAYLDAQKQLKCYVELLESF